MFGSKQAKSGASPKRMAWIVGGKYRFGRLNAGFWCIYGETCYNRGRVAAASGKPVIGACGLEGIDNR